MPKKINWKAMWQTICTWYNKETKLSHYAAVLSIWTLVMYNIPFLNFASEHAESSTWQKVLLLTSLTIVILVLNYMMIYLFVYCFRMVGRVLIAITNFLNAACLYFIIRFNTMMDSTMMSNVFNTRYSEASGFMCWQLWVAVIVIGVLPAIYIIKRKVQRGTGKQLGIHVGVSLAIILALGACNFKRTLWYSKYDTELGGLVMPWSYVANSTRVLIMYIQANRKEIPLPHAKISNTNAETVIFIMGESTRRANCQLYGYQKETNPRLSQVADLHVLKAVSCATYTTAGVKAMMEHEDTGNKLYEILPNYLYRTGVDVWWRSSNWGETPLHIDDHYRNRADLAKQYGTSEAYDETLFCGLKEMIEQCPKDKQLIIIHTSTSHGPEYKEQYPSEFSYFNDNDVVGSYDNTIRYTDHYLADLIDTLRTIQNRNVAMIFMSDHGESLGEDGVYMHGSPMKMAPREQYEIPCFIWTSEGYRTIKSNLGEVDQHGVFHSVLNLLSIDSPIYNETCDWFVKPTETKHQQEEENYDEQK